jgi:hypothetical protein
MPAMIETAQDPRIERARTRRMLEDTALVATGGGRLTTLAADPADPDVFHARVTRGDLVDIAVRLDRRLGIAEVAAPADDRALALA